MASSEQLPTTLQETVLALLCFDEGHGAAAAGLVESTDFDGLYRPVAEAVLRYRKDYGRAPGKPNLQVLLDQIPRTDRQTGALQQLATSLWAQADGLNGEYILGGAEQWVRAQALKGALYAASDRFMSGGELGLADDVETILYDALRTRRETMAAGARFSDERSLKFLDFEQRHFYPLGIPSLDHIGLGMIPKEFLLYIATKGSGKSWFCVHCARQALIHKARVLYVSLEMSDDRVWERMHQNWFSISQRPDQLLRTTLTLDDLDRLTDVTLEKVSPGLHLKDPKIKQKIIKLREPWGIRLGRLMVKDFPTGSLTVAQLSAYLDFLERVEKFIPDVLIVDYPDLMKLTGDEYRHSLDAIYKDLRGLCVRRNMAGVFPTQSNRKGLTAKNVGSEMVAEDIRKINTADNVLSYTQTKAERRINLARLLVSHGRYAESGILNVMSQSYATGQYVLESASVQHNYWDLVKTNAGPDPGDNEEDEESQPRRDQKLLPDDERRLPLRRSPHDTPRRR